MTPRHHPQTDTLISYVAGALQSAESCAIACHISMCADCAADVRRLETLGGLLMEGIAAPAGDKATAEQALTRAAAENSTSAPELRISHADLPLPLSRYLAARELTPSWQIVDEGLEQCSVALPERGGQIRLWRIAPGKHLAEASGSEFALLFRGVLRQGESCYLPGDFLELSPTQRGRPEAIEPCVCLTFSSDAVAEHNRLFSFPGRITGEAFAAGRQLWAHTEWRTAIAASVAMLLGLGLGWMLGSATEGIAFAPQNMVQMEGSRLIAKGPLRTALEESPSGTTAPPTSTEEAPIKITMTFQNHSGDYCRDYQIALSSPASFRGVACRTGGEWTLVLQTIVPPRAAASSETVLAGPGVAAAIDQIIAAMVRDNPLMAEEERPLIESGWKK